MDQCSVSRVLVCFIMSTNLLGYCFYLDELSFIKLLVDVIVKATQPKRHLSQLERNALAQVHKVLVFHNG